MSIVFSRVCNLFLLGYDFFFSLLQTLKLQHIVKFRIRSHVEVSNLTISTLREEIGLRTFHQKLLASNFDWLIITSGPHVFTPSPHVFHKTYEVLLIK